MANPMTSGFDAVAQLSEEMLNRLLVLQYFSNPLLQRLSQESDPALLPIGVEVSGGLEILIPSLSLHVNRLVGQDSTLQLILPFDGTITIKQYPLAVQGLVGAHHVMGSLKITIPLTKTTDTVAGSASTVFVLDFTLVQKEQVSVDISNFSSSDPVGSVLHDVIQTGAVGFSPQFPGALQQIPPLTVLSLPTGNLQRIEIVTKNSSAEGDPTCMALLLMFSKITNPPTPQDVDLLLAPNDDYAMAISKEGFESLSAQALLDSLNATKLPAKSPDDDSIIVKRVDLTLADGHIDVSGTVTKTWDCWWDTDVDFSGPVYLDKNLKATLGDINIDLPWWLDLLDILVPFVGSIIHRIVELVVEQLGSSYLQNFGVASPFDLSSFGVQGAKPLRIDNSTVQVKKDGIVIHGLIYLYTFVGNHRTKEIHIFSDQKWIGAMNARNKVYMERPQDYLALGYNGCAFCFSQLDTG